MSAVKLYHSTPREFERESIVTICEQHDSGFLIELDAAIIFPESGGQLSDTGQIDGQPVERALLRENTVLYQIQNPIDVGKRVLVSVDPHTVLDHSQQHTGEHILSGLAHKMFNAANVGFHMGVDYATIDMDKGLSSGEIRALERAANETVQSDIPVTCEIVMPSELPSYALRKRAEGLESGTEAVRIIRVGDVDSCTCCGTHVSRSGEVGTIKISQVKSYKGGVRIWFLCGMRAVDDYINKQNALDAISRQFSIKSEDALSAVKLQSNEISTLKRVLRDRTDALMAYRSRELSDLAQTIRNTTIITQLEENLSSKDLKLLCDKLLANNKKALAALFSVDGGTVHYVLGCSNEVTPPMNELAQTVNALIGGKGGGRATLAQGSAPYSAQLESMLEQALNQLSVYLKNSVGR